jgi:uncharacterized protein (TIGR02646 family)
MQYIEKQNTPPVDWEKWFTTGTGKRTYDYKADSAALPFLRDVKKFLIEEQHGLCAYCNQKINIDNASIEHIIPKECNVPFSTSYTNLIAVCKTPLKDPKTGKDHCDKEKGSHIITPLVLLSNCDVTEKRNNPYFGAHTDGTIYAKSTRQADFFQAQAFIETLNLNHYLLMESRSKDMLAGLLQGFMACDVRHQRLYLKTQFDRIMADKKIPHRQFLLIYLAGKLGIN